LGIEAGHTRRRRLEGDFVSALKLLQTRTYISTGCLGLDKLLGGGIEKGKFYLFYGQEKSGIDYLIHQLMENALTNDSEDKIIYLNCGNYREDKTILDISSLVYLAQTQNLDPNNILDRIMVFCAFSEEQQEQVVEEIRRTIEHENTIKLLAIHDMAKLFTSQSVRESYKRIPHLQRTVSRLWQACSEKGVAIVSSCGLAKVKKGSFPKPEGGRYVSHLVNSIIYLEKTSGLVQAYQAYLLKHSALSPSRTLFGIEDEKSAGRITMPSNMKLELRLESLNIYRRALIDVEEQAACDVLMEACKHEHKAILNSNIPTSLEAMLLTGLVNSMNRFMHLENHIQCLAETLENRTG